MTHTADCWLDDEVQLPPLPALPLCDEKVLLVWQLSIPSVGRTSDGSAV